MLRGLMFVLTAVLLAAGNYINVYVEGGPSLSPGENVFVFDGRSWVPVEVVYIPEIIPTLVLATGEWVDTPHYRLDRYILKIPKEALGKTGRPPAGYAQWTLKTEDGKRTTLAVGPAMQRGDLQLGTWYRLAQTPITDYLRGVIETDQQRDPERDLGDQRREADEADAARAVDGLTRLDITSVTGTVFVQGSIYFAPVQVSGLFDVYVPPQRMDFSDIRICGDANTNWIGFESHPRSLRIGIFIEGGAVADGFVDVELYSISLNCSLVARRTIAFAGTGVFFTEVDMGYTPSPDEELALKIRVRGSASGTTTLYVNPVMSYSKQVNDYTQLGVNHATYIHHAPTTPLVIPPRTRWSVMIGPFIWGDGAIQTLPYAPVLQTSRQLLRFSWPSNIPCPTLQVTYYINGLYLTQRQIMPTQTGSQCAYNIPSETLQIMPTRIYYEYARYIRPSGALTLHIEYRLSTSTPPSRQIYLSISQFFNTTTITWTEPFPSPFIAPRENHSYLHWLAPRLLAVTDVIYTRANDTIPAARAVSKVVASNEIVLISLESNRGIERAVWEIRMSDDGYSILYGNTLVQEPWWQSTALMVLDGLNFFFTLAGLVDARLGLGSMALFLVSSIVRSASAQLSYDGHRLEFRKGWSESPPTSVYIAFFRVNSGGPRSFCTTWRLREIHFTFIQVIPQIPEQTICLPPSVGGGGVHYKMWTCRGLTAVSTGFKCIVR